MSDGRLCKIAHQARRRLVREGRARAQTALRPRGLIIEAAFWVRNAEVAADIAGRMVVLFDGAIAEFATAIAARSDLSSRDALHLLRETFRAIRARASNLEAAAGAALPPVLADDEAS